MGLIDDLAALSFRDIPSGERVMSIPSPPWRPTYVVVPNAAVERRLFQRQKAWLYVVFAGAVVVPMVVFSPIVVWKLHMAWAFVAALLVLSGVGFVGRIVLGAPLRGLQRRKGIPLKWSMTSHELRLNVKIFLLAMAICVFDSVSFFLFFDFISLKSLF
ncbi:MAG: hypothetical protein KDE22_17990 [Rhodobacterales bacterium]|nr:hypothetical protein [Rhodobacterales bacterium]